MTSTPINVRIPDRLKLSDFVTEELGHLISRQELKPGDKLPSESQLAERFKVSKPIVREALKQLAAKGVVDIQQGKATTVRAPTSESITSFFRLAGFGADTGLREALEARRVLETELVGLAAERVTDEELEELEAVFARMEASLETLDPWVEADLAFHVMIAKAAKNGLLFHVVEALNGLFQETIRALHAQRERRNSRATLQRHRDILDALRRRDPEGARRAMGVHFDATESVVLALAAPGGEGR